jgi:LPS-assembly protein
LMDTFEGKRIADCEIKVTRTSDNKMRTHTAYMFSAFLLASVLAGSPQYAVSAEFPKTVPVTVTADKLDYDRVADVYTAEGHVKIEHGTMRLEADKVVLNNKTGEAAAEGKVFLQDKGDSTRADKMQLNVNTRSGVMYKGDIFINKQNLHVKGDMIERRSETVYHVEKGLITTCDEDQWYLKANELDVDLDRYASGKGVSFNMLGVPLLYTPYFLFPVKRQTGFLIPEVGNSSVDGLHIVNSFFWAISDSKDMTLSSDYRQKIGHGTGIEYRYNNSNESAGKVYAKFWDLFQPSDVREQRFQHKSDESRWEFRLQHQEEFAEDLSGRLDINLVSDEHYYKDLDKKLEMRAKPSIDSNAFYVERWNTASLYLLGQYSTDLTQTNGKTIQKLPEIRYTIFQEPLLGPLHLGFDGSAVSFVKEHGDGLRRVDFNPQLAATLGGNGLSLTPRVGARGTFYDRSLATSGTTSLASEPTVRKYVSAGADLNARISRVYGTDKEEGIGRIRHSIEPTISYDYISSFGTASIPQFDSVDSVVSMSTVTVSLINRITARYKESKDAPDVTTFDLLVLKLSQGYNLRTMGTTTNHRSELQGDISLNAPKFFSMTANGGYNTETGHLSSRSVGAGLTTKVLLMNLSYKWEREAATPAEYVIAGAGLKLWKWDMTAQYSYDVMAKSMTQAEYRLHYASQCWGIRMAYIRSPGESRITATLDLAGLGGSFGKMMGGGGGLGR